MLLSLALEKAVERSGFVVFPSGDPTDTFSAALAAGSDVLDEVLRTAIADRKYDLAAVAATALGAVTDRDALAPTAESIRWSRRSRSRTAESSLPPLGHW